MKLSDISYFARQIIKMHLWVDYKVPLSLYVVLTNHCNNHCIYCRVHKLPQEDILTTESLKIVMQEMKACGTKRIHFTGGEPMLRDDIGKVIQYAKELGFFVGMSTSGYRIAKRIDELKGIDVIFLSYDGPPQIHGHLRGQNNVEEVLSALYALKKANIKVWTTTILTRWNVNFIDDIINFAIQNNIFANFNRLEFFTEPQCYLHPYIDEVKDLVLWGEERKKVFQKLIKSKLSGAPIGSSLEYLKNALEWPYDDRITDLKPAKRYRCWAGRAYGHLEADGKLYACGWGALRQLPGINVLEKGFRFAWENITPLSDCQSCSHACGVENNLIFSLNASSILNAFVHLRL